MSDKDHEVIQPPDTLKGKVSFSADGVDLEMLEKAEQIVAGLQGSYLEWVQEDLKKLQALYDEAKAADTADRAALFKAIFNVAHDVKGQGGSFGYHLMTAVGNQLCRFLEAAPQAGEGELQVVALHIDAMRLIIAQRMEGEGGRQGEAMLRGLQAVVAKVGKG